MTDKIEELIGRLRGYRPTNEWGDGVHHVICTEAADALAALRAQRNEVVEECARVAEGQLYNPPADEYDESWNDACGFIATAIRNLKSQDEPR